jgi:putative flavoprotein involved in K+ transport
MARREAARTVAAMSEHFETIVIGAGQAGLSVGHHLARRGRSFLILEAGERVGDNWRNRYDSLRLYSPARYDGLPGWDVPLDAWAYPTKDEIADYLEAYAQRFELPVITGVRVEHLRFDGERYVLRSGAHLFTADNVVVASGTFQEPIVPDFARELDPAILQLHSSAYRAPTQLRPGGVLLVGVGNSGAEIARELALAGHPTWLAGRPVGEVPFRPDGRAGRLFLTRLVVGFVFHRILTVRTPIGRRVRPKVLAGGSPLIRVKSRDLDALGVERAPRVVGVRDGRPLLADDRVLDVANVIWCTGFGPAFSWIDRPIFEPNGVPRHERGVVPGEPGLYFVGLHFLYAMSSSTLRGVGRDAEHLVGVLAARVRAAAASQPGRPVEERRPLPA